MRDIMGTTQSQDIGKNPNQTNQPDKPGTRNPQQPDDRPAPHSGQDKGKGEGENRPGGQMGDKDKGRGAPSRPA
jgi:hypothetical protein